MNDEFWSKLSEGAKNIPENWSARVVDTIKQERREFEKRYGIRIGRIEICCARCGKPWGLGNHVCQDIRFEMLKEKREEKISKFKDNENKVLKIVKNLGPKKTSIYLMLPERTVTSWVQRKSVPRKYIDRIFNL